MKPFTIGLIREGKSPPDKRVPLTPAQCRELLDTYPSVTLLVQSSPIRIYTDDEYRKAGIPVTEEMSECDILLGVKEVPIDHLIPGKTYLFFSHTIKEQPYNRPLLQAVLEKRIRLIDYECLTDTDGIRMIGFGRYAGIVGAYNGLIGYGKRTGRFDLKPAHQCIQMSEMKEELEKIEFGTIKIVITGRGRVGRGAREVMKVAGFRNVTPEDFLTRHFQFPAFCQLGGKHYNIHTDGQRHTEEHFYDHPSEYTSAFLPYVQTSDLFISCHYWDPQAPRLFTIEDLNNPSFSVQVIADITCDIEGSIPTTVAPTTIEDPFYGYNRRSHQKDEPFQEDSITVMAVDNLPCEVPRDASEGFGKEFVQKVLPLLIKEDPEKIIEKAVITLDGKLTDRFQYLSDYVHSNQD